MIANAAPAAPVISGLVGSKAVQGHRPERRIAGRLEDHRLRPVIEPEPAPFPADMRAQQPGPAPEPDQLAAQFLGRPVRGLSDIVLIRQDLLAHKALGALLELDEFVRQRKIHWCLRKAA